MSLSSPDSRVVALRGLSIKARGRGPPLMLPCTLAGKVIREGMGQMANQPDSATLDCIITNALIIDWNGIYKVRSSSSCTLLVPLAVGERADAGARTLSLARRPTSGSRRATSSASARAATRTSWTASPTAWSSASTPRSSRARSSSSRRAPSTRTVRRLVLLLRLLFSSSQTRTTYTRLMMLCSSRSALHLPAKLHRGARERHRASAPSCLALRLRLRFHALALGPSKKIVCS